jgi:PAS domain S-box-containing protein
MYSKSLVNGRNLSLFFVGFGLLGGLWIISILVFPERFPDADLLRRWELIPCLGFLLLAAELVFFQIRDMKKSLENSRAALQRVRLALKARSECSQVLVRATDENKLMGKICRIIVDSEGYRLAWVGFAMQDSEKTVQPVAQWGCENGYLETLKVSWGDNEHGRGPTGTAIRTGQPFVAQHILTDPKWEPWRERALKCGYASSISLPLADGGRNYGALVIFAGEPDAFDKQEVDLLKGLADDLSYGIATLRLRKEQERGKQERMLLATIIEQEADGVLTFDTEGRIQYVNPAFETVGGYGRDELVGRNIREIASDGPNRSFFRLMVQSKIHAQACSGRFVNHRKDGTPYDVETRVFPVSGAVGITAYAAVIRDMTHEVKLQRQLRQAQKMEAIATLSGGIAHDFNNILAAITTNTEMALDHVPEKDVLREHLAIVLKAGFRAKNLVKQIMTLSCQVEKERQPVRLDHVVGECMKLLRASLPSTIEMRHHSGGDSGLVLADPGQIHQVIMNLCTNAADAMREKGGTLAIMLRNIDLEAGDPAAVPQLSQGRYVRLSIADTGHGINPEAMERIFDPFFTTKGPGRGTGLGLSVVHGIVKNHGGGISFSSLTGKGTVFHVFLPRTDLPEKALEESSAEPLTGGRERILFLDDEEDLVFAGQRMLEKLGYDVVAGTDSLEALEVFRSQPDRFDLVITDQTMPRLTGERLAREILCLRRDIPIILCTGLGGGGGLTADDARAAGIREVVMKPVERSEFARIIRRVLDQNQ